MKYFSFVRIAAFFFVISTGVQAAESPRILLIGDSLMAVHKLTGRAISDGVERVLGEPIIDRSVIGAQIIYHLPISGSMGLNIGKQYRGGDWDWVIVNGGGNDVWLGCGCFSCERKINRLISANGGRGQIPKMISRLRQSGARVVYVGYLRSPGVGSPIEGCKDEGDLLEERIVSMAAADQGVFFVSLKDLVPYGDRTFHAFDMIHPSVKASRAIGALIAGVIQANE